MDSAALGAENGGETSYAFLPLCLRELLLNLVKCLGLSRRTEKTVGSENILVWCSIETLAQGGRGPGKEENEDGGRQLWGRDGPISSLRR